jgi:hypothetical protein
MKAFLFLCLFAWLANSAEAGQAATYVGSDSCRNCHEAAWKNWRTSGHFKAMLPASPETVLGDFDDATFEYAGLTHRFYRRGGRFLVETDNARGELQEFEIHYTFGYYPLQQYLVGFPDGRYQALNIVWDTRPAAAGGQRWYHLYADDAVTHDDILHWTGSFQNWNSRCASDRTEKNYSQAPTATRLAGRRSTSAARPVMAPARHRTGLRRPWARPGVQQPPRGQNMGRGGEKPTLRRQDGALPGPNRNLCGHHSHGTVGRPRR